MSKPRRNLFPVTTIAIIGLLQLTLFGVLAVELVKQMLNASEAQQRVVSQSLETINRLDHVFQLVQVIEKGDCSFVNTGEREFLEPYDNAMALIDAELRLLQLSNNPELRLLARTVIAKLRFCVTTMSVRERLGLAAADRIDGQNGKRPKAAERSQLAKVRSGERELLALRLAAQYQQRRRSEFIIYGATISSQFFSFTIGTLLIFHYRRRRGAERVARQRASLLRATLENVDTGIALIGEDGSIRDRNVRFAELGKTTSDGETPLIDAQVIAAAERREAIRFETAIGDTLAVEVRGRTAPDDLYVVTYNDISERKRSDRLKDDFVSTVSHELRTPLTAIRGALGLLLGPLAKNLPANIVSLLEIADRNAARLTGLVNDLLDIDKLVAGRMQLHLAPVDLNTLAFDAAEANRTFAVKRGIKITVGRSVEPIIVSADARRLHQVMSNLVSNAAKFSSENGIVTITVERIGAMARVSVRDEGSGVPDAFRSRIFEKFAQAASGDAKHVGGSGLGLSISKAIVEQHGGEIGFTSKSGATEFYFILQIDQSLAATPAALLPASARSAVPKFEV